MQQQEKDDRLWKALREGPLGREIEAQAEADRSAQCAAVRQAYEAGQAKYQSDADKMQSQLDQLGGRVKELKAQLEPIEKEWLDLSWKLADKRAAATEHRDRHWRELTALAHPRIAIIRAEFEARFRACELMHRVWQTGPARSVYERPPTASNYAATQRAARYLLEAIDATTRWAREGLQGDEIDRAYAEIMSGFPRIPMSKDDPGAIPEPTPG